MILMRLKAWRDSKRRQLSIIPFILTFANACLGLMSVLYALEDKFLAAAYCIIAAALFDGLDGKLARAFGSCSSLGMELDSLCDAISFCFAPAILLYSWSLWTKNWIGAIVVSLYLCAGLFRLAKFNLVTHENKQFFIGLPTTVASAWLAGFVIAAPWLVISRYSFLLNPGNIVVIVGLLSLLMISRLHFPSFKSRHSMVPVFMIIPITILFSALYSLIAQAPLCLLVVTAYIMTCLCVQGILFLTKNFWK